MIASLWESMASFFTPTSLFLFVNLMIGTIFITCRFGTHHQQHHYHAQLGHYDTPHLLTRTPSLLERVKSMNLSLYKFDPPNPEIEHLHLQHTELRYETHYPYPSQDGAHRLARQPSLLERFKSMNLSPYRFEQPTQETEHFQLTEPEFEPNDPPQLARQPSFLDRLKSINFSRYKFEQPTTETEHMQLTDTELETHNPTQLARHFSSYKFEQPTLETGYIHPTLETEYIQPTLAEFETHIDSPRLDRQLSLLDRFKTLKLPSLYPHEQPDPETETDPDLYDNSIPINGHLVKKSKSDSRNGVSSKKSQPEKMKKSASDKGKARYSEDDDDDKRGNETVSFGDEDEEVDAKADDFINRFKNQLRLQRLESFKAFW